MRPGGRNSSSRDRRLDVELRPLAELFPVSTSPRSTDWPSRETIMIKASGPLEGAEIMELHPQAAADSISEQYFREMAAHYRPGDTGAIGNAPKREGTSAILISTDGDLLLQIRDDLPHVSDAGKIGLFGGRREGDESFLACIVREVHEEIGLYLPPDRFELIGTYLGPDNLIPGGIRYGPIYVARNVPVEQLIVTEGTLRIVPLNEIERIQDLLASAAKYALRIFLKPMSCPRSTPPA